MKTAASENHPAASAPRFDETAACDECGHFGAFDLSGRMLCQDCYQGACSCCPEFGKDAVGVAPPDAE